ncbi:hypothetical protein EMIHUDRAFT_114844 [Emiliania huxleyi CCMP1516]|uniref:Uncharacterized protein n=2 Tax=Emiliania huxleyi TaxID=2903 RepID=A0A0D3JTW6_EMIH1|nr:hypothetical protein EMIHUDRAFT_114844 [Emiliania huxleyi CCMP1516]EOD26951.1 hypothetical protein EMIHUDRAFT_114844 [Emiliania huxleyi CCMP1516]|eukprot:XP_005779380.1 hypothetical protein EMIHUDRAFT_114844 [Emiliania huxleyi CCMP1516]
MGCHASRPQEYDDLAGLASTISSGLQEERAEGPIPANAEAEPATALASATDLGVSERMLEGWRKWGGGDLEPVLTSGAVALLDAQWIIRHAEAGGVLAHRQALPKEAFLSLADLVEATTERPWLPVAALSYPWLTKDHPDPRGANLSRVARALKALLSGTDYKGNVVLPRLGVFWDFGSLHQHPDPANGVLRTEEQNALFKQGLGCLGTLYSHKYTFVLRLTSFPDGHKAEEQAEGTNVAKYFDRGWCFTEQSWAGLTKAGFLSLDLGKMRAGTEYDCGRLVDDCRKDGGRRPPLLPSAFAAELESKSFTNGKDDKPLVKQLYEAAFEEQFGKATKLSYANLGWGDAEAAQLAEVLASGAAPRLEKLYLYDNQIGDEGCKALAAALGKEGAAPRLEELTLGENKLGDEGCKALAAALKEGAAPSLKARDATPRHTPLPHPMLIAHPLACRRSGWTTRSSLSWWPCARSAVSTSNEPLQPRPGGEGAGPGGMAARV